VRRHASAPNGAQIVIAEMEIGYKAIRERFTSRVTLDRAALKIIVEYIDGPFSHMRNVWTFTDDGPGASNVEFFIDYQFKSRILGALMGSMFDTAFRRFTAAFEARADILDPKPAG
jgi:coenzyme Q-binding protein COQ10